MACAIVSYKPGKADICAQRPCYTPIKQYSVVLLIDSFLQRSDRQARRCQQGVLRCGGTSSRSKERALARC